MGSTARVISGRPESPEAERLLRLSVMLEQTGGDPSAVLETLSVIIGNKDWRSLPDGNGGNHTFLSYFKEIGWSKEDLSDFVLKMKHRYDRRGHYRADIRQRMEELRQQVRDLTNPPALKRGGQQDNTNAAKPEAPSEKNEVDNINSVSKAKGGTSAAYIIQRLKRDADSDAGSADVKADLAQRVIRGELSANKAAVQAGYRKQQISVPLEPESAARILVKHFKGDARARLIESLVRLTHEAGTPIE